MARKPKPCIDAGDPVNETDCYGVRPLPLVPTAALPGTEAKVAVLEERARLRLNLWHPLDAKGRGDPSREQELLLRPAIADKRCVKWEDVGFVGQNGGENDDEEDDAA